tara:strand:- start:613 stop:1089 length:477 start_codon:yes stop_codon:yes gene_type:complete
MSHYESDSEPEFTNVNTIQDLSTDSENNDTTINNTISGGENDIEIMKKLTNLCIKYEQDLEKINKYKKILSEKLKKTKNALAPYMEKKEIDFININPTMGGGKLKYNKTKVYKSLSKKSLINLFNAYFGDEKKTQEIVKFLYDNREYKEVNKIVKTKK